MPNNYNPPKKKQPEVDLNKTIWCPFCPWHLPDGLGNSRRMGFHVRADHYDEIAFPNGVEPEMVDE